MNKFYATFLAAFVFVFAASNASSAIVPLGYAVANDEHVISDGMTGDLVSIGDLSFRQTPCMSGQWSTHNCFAPKILGGPTSNPICFDRCECPSSYVNLGPNEVGVGTSCDGKFAEFKCADGYVFDTTSGYCEIISQCDAQNFPETRSDVFNSSDWTCTALNSQKTCVDNNNTTRASCKCSISHCSLYTSTYPLSDCPLGAICDQMTCTTNPCCENNNTSSGCADLNVKKTTRFRISTCLPGYYKDGAICEECPIGYACAGGVKEACQEGTYQTNTKQSYCEACPESAIAKPGETPHEPEVITQCNL